MDLSELLAENACEIVDATTDTVLRVRLKHYAAEGRDAVRRQIEDLFGRLLACAVAQNATSMVEHARSIAEERFASGFGLHEVQTAMNVMEETIWLRLEAQLPPDEFAAAIRTVSSILGMGKDALATGYVLLAARTHAPALDLPNLFRGTDGV